MPDQDWSINRTLGVTTILTIIALIFSMGANYRRLSDTAETLQDFITKVESTYVRQDVSRQQFDIMNYQLQQLRNDVNELTIAVRDRPVPATGAPAPRFSR